MTSSFLFAPFRLFATIASGSRPEGVYFALRPPRQPGRPQNSKTAGAGTQ